MQSILSASGSMRALVFGLLVWGLAKPVIAVDVLDDPQQIDERLTQVIQASNSLCWEMYRYHQAKPDFRDTYKMTKDLWLKAVQTRDMLRTGGPMETQFLVQQVNDINAMTGNLETTLSKWGDGDRSSLVPGVTQQTVIDRGVGVNVPFVGIRVGGAPTVVTEEVFPATQPGRMHPNSHGSKRSLEREFAAMKVAVSYLVEDAGITGQTPTPAQAEGKGPTPDPALATPTPLPEEVKK